MCIHELGSIALVEVRRIVCLSLGQTQRSEGEESKTRPSPALAASRLPDDGSCSQTCWWVGGRGVKSRGLGVGEVCAYVG